MTVHSFHGDAARELEEATVFYESRVSGLGRSFLEEVERTVSLIERYPNAGAAISRNVRRVSLDRFPYSIVYRRSDDALVIIALAHQAGARVTGVDGSKHANSALLSDAYSSLRCACGAAKRER